MSHPIVFLDWDNKTNKVPGSSFEKFYGKCCRYNITVIKYYNRCNPSILWHKQPNCFVYIILVKICQKIKHFMLISILCVDGWCISLGSIVKNLFANYNLVVSYHYIRIYVIEFMCHYNLNTHYIYCCFLRFLVQTFK